MKRLILFLLVFVPLIAFGQVVTVQPISDNYTFLTVQDAYSVETYSITQTVSTPTVQSWTVTSSDASQLTYTNYTFTDLSGNTSMRSIYITDDGHTKKRTQQSNLTTTQQLLLYEYFRNRQKSDKLRYQPRQ